jgi:hypothetical protein
MNEEIESITITFANGLSKTVSGKGAQKAMQAMYEAFWKVEGSDYEGPNITQSAAREPMSELREALRVAKETVDGWTVDSDGRVHVHKDVISKAINAAWLSFEKLAAKGAPGTREAQTVPEKLVQEIIADVLCDTIGSQPRSIEHTRMIVANRIDEWLAQPGAPTKGQAKQ